MKKCLIGATHNISDGLYSHKSAWARMWAQQLGVELITGNKTLDLSEYDVVYIDQGMEFAGSLNLFGGAVDVGWAKRLMTIKGDIISLDQPLGDYGELGKSRLRACSDEWAAFDWDALSELCKKATTLKQSDRKTKKLCFGDSHSFSALPSLDYMACRNDGLTMFGAIKKGFSEWITPFGEIDSLVVYLGNIDIRHHLCRQEDPVKSTKDLVDKLGEELKSLGIKNIEIVAPLPIESEDRVLPKTGWYKGTPFAGSWVDRDIVMSTMISSMETLCKNNGYSLFTWPESWYKMSPINFMSMMEKPRSVHLAYANYRWIEQESNLDSFFN